MNNLIGEEVYIGYIQGEWDKKWSGKTGILEKVYSDEPKYSIRVDDASIVLFGNEIMKKANVEGLWALE